LLDGWQVLTKTERKGDPLPILMQKVGCGTERKDRFLRLSSKEGTAPNKRKQKVSSRRTTDNTGNELGSDDSNQDGILTTT